MSTPELATGMAHRPLSATASSGLTRWQSGALLLLAALIWGSAFVGQALGMDGVGPLTFTAIRFMLGALLVLPLALREWHQLQARGHRLGRQQTSAIVVMGTLLCAGVVMQQIALMTTSVTNAGFLTALYVPLVPVLAWLAYRQLPHWSVWPAALGCLVGTWLLTGASLQALQRGDLWLLGSVGPWAVHVLLVGHLANRLRGAYVLACGQFAVCAVLSGLMALALETLTLDGLGRAASSIAYTGFVSVGIGYTLQVVGQRHAHPADAAIILSSETVFAALFGAWFMGDRVGVQGLAGAGLILACIVAVQVIPLLRRRLSA